MASRGKKFKKRGKEKRRKITVKKGEKALKMHLFGIRRARRKLICRGKKLISKRGEGGNTTLICDE